MLNYLAKFAAAAIMAVCVSGQPNKATNHTEQPTVQSQSTVTTSKSPNKQSTGYAAQAKADSNQPKWHGWPDWLLVIVGFGTLVVVGWQTKILARSVAASQKAADAAKTSADIAAGVSVPTLAIHEFEVGNVGDASAEAFFQYPKIKITIKNYGQTPAFLKSWSLCFTCEDLPDIPVYDGPGGGIVLEKMAIEPGKTCTLPELAFFHRRQFSTEDVQAIINREKIFKAYGYICYGDIFGNPLRRFKFCETVLNIYGGEVICDWWEGLAPPAYTGIDFLPIKKTGTKDFRLSGKLKTPRSQFTLPKACVPPQMVTPQPAV